MSYLIVSFLQLLFPRMINDPPAGEEPQRPFPHRPRKNFLLLFIICGLILLPLQSLVGADSENLSNDFYQILNSNQTEILDPAPLMNQDYSKLLHHFDLKQMEGVWKHKNGSDKKSVLSYHGGKATMNFGKHIINNTENTYAILELFNGNYIDHGYIQLVIALEVLRGLHTFTKGNYTFYMSDQVEVRYNKMIKLKVLENQKQLNITSLNISFLQSSIDQKPSISLSINSEDLEIEIVEAKENWHVFHHILLSALLCTMISMEFISSIRIIRKLGLGQQAADKYSILTFFAMLMWDLAVTIITVFLCFSNDQLFLIYLIPTFISTILFAMMELRILQFIFQAGFQNRGANYQQMGRFMGWLGLVSTYPLIYYTNLNSIFFVLLPLIFLPQLYKNAKRGRKMQIDTDFMKLFLPRFALVLYLKGFSRNVFSLEPSYTCCIGMLLMLGVMMGLLFIQRQYGTRIVFPKFLLPQIYNYFQDESGYSIDIEVGHDNVQDCAICLMPVHIQPAEESQLSGEHVGKIMTTPCNHKFHGSCLVQWIQHKMECPTCRNKLPAYQ